MRDPKEVVKEATSEIKTDFLVSTHYTRMHEIHQCVLQDTDLADTHAARAFKEYISARRKTLRKTLPRASIAHKPSVRTLLTRTNQTYDVT